MIQMIKICKDTLYDQEHATLQEQAPIWILGL